MNLSEVQFEMSCLYGAACMGLPVWLCQSVEKIVGKWLNGGLGLVATKPPALRSLFYWGLLNPAGSNNPSSLNFAYFVRERAQTKKTSGLKLFP